IDAIESISEGFCLYDADDKLILFNSRYPEMLHGGATDVIERGVSFETIARSAAANGLIPDARGRVDEWVAGRLEQHRNPKGTHLQRRADGRWIQINERKTDAGGIVATYADVTGLKQAEAAIQESEHRLRMIVDAAPVALVIVTLDDGLIRLVNKRFCK